MLFLVGVNTDQQQASPGLPTDSILPGGAGKLRQIDDKACHCSSLLLKARLPLKAHAPCG